MPRGPVRELADEVADLPAEVVLGAVGEVAEDAAAAEPLGGVLMQRRHRPRLLGRRGRRDGRLPDPAPHVGEHVG